MKNITDSYIQSHLRSATDALVPEKAEELWQTEVPKASGSEWYLDGLTHKRSGFKTMVRFLSSAAACLLVCVMAVYMVQMRTDATIYLDVNPSVELQINRREKILLARANNPDGEIILDNMKLKNTDLDIAMNAILGSMVRHGYLNEAENLILLSVNSKDTDRAETLQRQLTVEIDECLDSMLGEGSILNQTVETTEELEELASEYEITPGKAYLLQQIIEKYPELNYGELAELTINKLIPYLQNQGIDPQEFIDCSGAPLKKPETEEADDEEQTEEIEETEEQTEETEKEDAEPEDADSEDPVLEETEIQEIEKEEPVEQEKPDAYEEPQDYDEPEIYEEPEYDEPDAYEEPEYEEPEEAEASDEEE